MYLIDNDLPMITRDTSCFISEVILHSFKLLMGDEVRFVWCENNLWALCRQLAIEQVVTK